MSDSGSDAIHDDSVQRRPLIAGNWKMHADSAAVGARLCGMLQSGTQLADDFAGLDADQRPEVLLLAPFPYLALCQLHLGAASPPANSATDGAAAQLPISYGAQNLCAEDAVAGAYTGEVSAAMLCDLGCEYVLVGHSERRQYYAETGEILQHKLQHALKQGLRVIYCIGETLAEREMQQTQEVLRQQLQALQPVLAALALKDASQIVIAYEPVWAIGTGVSASANDAQLVHAFIRQWLCEHAGALAERLRIIYGGSVKPSNAGLLLQQPDIDGALVGGASLDYHDFVGIIQQCSR